MKKNINKKKYCVRGVLIVSVVLLIILVSWQNKVEQQVKYSGSIDAMNDVQESIKNEKIN